VTVAAFLAELRSRDVAVWSDGNDLRCNAPPGVLTAGLRDELRERKLEIVRFLRASEIAARQERAIVPLQSHGERTPIFAVGGHNGDIFCYRLLSQYLGDDQPFFGLRPPGLDGECGPATSVTDMASYFARQVARFQPTGPLIIAGYCAGGAIAFELAQVLRREGRHIERIALFAGRYPTWFRAFSQLRHRTVQFSERIPSHLEALRAAPQGARLPYLINVVRGFRARAEDSPIQPGDQVLKSVADVQAATMRAIQAYTPAYFGGRLSLFLPSPKARRPVEGLVRWRGLAHEVDEYCGPPGCVGDSMLLEPHVRAIARLFRASCDTNGIS